MDTSQIYIFLSILGLALVTLFVLVINRNKTGKEKSLNPLAGLAFAFILTGLFFGDYRFIGYGLMGVGVTLALIVVVNKLKKKTKKPFVFSQVLFREINPHSNRFSNS